MKGVVNKPSNHPPPTNIRTRISNVGLHSNATYFFVASSSILVGLIRTYVPPDEVRFATVVGILCLTFLAAMADPETFFESLFATVPFLETSLPTKVRVHIRKSIECLREGEHRVLVAKNSEKKGEEEGGGGGTEDNKSTTIPNRQLYQEICRRIQWRYVLPATATGMIVKYIAYEKPKVVGKMMDAVVQDGATMDTAFWPYLRRLVLFVLSDFFFVSCREYFKHAALHRYQADVRADMLANLLDQEQDFLHSEKHSAGFVHLLNRETGRMQKLVNGMLPRVFFALVSTVGGIYTVMSVDYRLALIGIFLKSPILAALQSMSRKDIVKYGKLYEKSSGEASRIAKSILDPEIIHLLQSHVAQTKLVEMYKSKQEEFINYLEHTHFRQTVLCMVPHGLRNIEDCLLLAMGLSSVLQGKITVGTYTTFRSQLALLNQGPKELIGAWNDVVTIRMLAGSYFELMYRESKIPCSGGSNCGGTIPEHTENGLAISFNGVSFAYRLNPKVNVLDDVNLSLSPGKIVALCGGSGGGKTTITRLIQRFYDPTEGSVELNGVDIRSIDVSWLRTQIRTIDQDPMLLDMTIFENIAIGLSKDDAEKGPEYIRERVIEAAKLAEAHDFIIHKCESGYDTPIQQIHRLSGGQRQRIAIARALVSRAPILICDEVTSALDAGTEKTIVRTLFESMKGKTVLLIAHRLSTIRHADEIVFFEHGKIMERGSHDQLVELNGRYSSYLKTLNQGAGIST